MVIHRTAAALPKGLPAWFEEFDQDGDGHIILPEWVNGGKRPEDFRAYDLNGDGFITPEEVLQVLRTPIELKLVKGQAQYRGAIGGADEKYAGKLAKLFNVKLEAGRTYQFDNMSTAFDAYLYLIDPDGEVLAEDDDGGEGTNSRIVHRVTRGGIYRLVATSLGGARSGAFSLSARVAPDFGGIAAKSLPAWFKNLDTDGDGQVALYEWRQAGKPLDEFAEFDRNDDGFITPEEIVHHMRHPSELTLVDGRAEYAGTIEETTDERYRGKKSFKIFTIRLEPGKTYQIDHTSKVFQAFLHLEDADGIKLKENSSPNIGGNSRIVFRAQGSGTYRLIATSLGGFRTGAFTLSIRPSRGVGALPKGVPQWFSDLDEDGDGQIALYEWRKSGKSRREFRQYDLNDDGFITLEEMLRRLPPPMESKRK